MATKASSGEQGLLGQMPQVTFGLHEVRALEVALQHGLTCQCENCMTAVFAVQRAMKPFKAVGSPHQEEIEAAEQEIATARYRLGEAYRKMALLVGDGQNEGR